MSVLQHGVAALVMCLSLLACQTAAEGQGHHVSRALSGASPPLKRSRAGKSGSTFEHAQGTIHAVTWNRADGAEFSPADILQTLRIKSQNTSPDMYVIGIQEQCANKDNPSVFVRQFVEHMNVIEQVTSEDSHRTYVEFGHVFNKPLKDFCVSHGISGIMAFGASDLFNGEPPKVETDVFRCPGGKSAEKNIAFMSIGVTSTRKGICVASTHLPPDGPAERARCLQAWTEQYKERLGHDCDGLLFMGDMNIRTGPQTSEVGSPGKKKMADFADRWKGPNAFHKTKRIRDAYWTELLSHDELVGVYSYQASPEKYGDNFHDALMMQNWPLILRWQRWMPQELTDLREVAPIQFYPTFNLVKPDKCGSSPKAVCIDLPPGQAQAQRCRRATREAISAAGTLTTTGNRCYRGDRPPSWTDRIVFAGSRFMEDSLVKPIYGVAEVSSSDHEPVMLIIQHRFDFLRVPGERGTVTSTSVGSDEEEGDTRHSSGAARHSPLRRTGAFKSSAAAAAAAAAVKVRGQSVSTE
eukprot:GFYU01027280.1.p1 GENE.GFYU01027280.1~~GFYU01027280.1.p1  ORF type:complete len:524 (-),score=67.41 GFYU01027280.1:294-1865(-)